MNFFCQLPWTSMMVEYTWQAKPCCKFQVAYDLSTYQQNPELISVKKQLLQGQAPSQCNACVHDEATTGNSFRLLHNKFDSIETSIKEQNDPEALCLTNLAITTSTICNLKCLPCEGGSFVRDLELHKLGFKKNMPVKGLSENLNRLPENYLLFDTVEVITFTGGEPFYDNITFEFLENIVKNVKNHKKISIHINTNMTHITKEKLDFLVTNFKKITIKASIDGIGPVNDYLRYPSNWNTIAQHLELVKTYADITLLMTSTVTNLSLMRMYEVIKFCIENKYSLFFLPVSSPSVLQPNHLPSQIKHKLLTIYQELKTQYSGKIFDTTEWCIDTAINICSNEFESVLTVKDTIAWCQRHDELRKTDLFQVFPELLEYQST